MENPFRTQQSLFNGRFKLITEDNEMRMSHWVKGFGIAEGETGASILQLNTSFHLEKFEEGENTLKVWFQIYPDGRIQYESEINLFDKTFSYNGESKHLELFWDTYKG